MPVPSRLGGVFAVLAAVALLASSCGGSGTLGAAALEKQSSSLSSLAAEGALLGRDAVAGKTTRIFTRVHSGYLAKAASQSASSLRTAKTEPALEPKLRKVSSLASTVSIDLKRLGDAPKAEQGRLARELQAAARELA